MRDPAWEDRRRARLASSWMGRAPGLEQAALAAGIQLMAALDDALTARQR